MLQRLISTGALRRIQLQTPSEKLHCDLLPLGQALPRVATRTPQDNTLQTEAGAPNRRDRRLKHAAVQQTRSTHALLPKDGRDLNHGVHVVGRVEEGEAARENG